LRIIAPRLLVFKTSIEVDIDMKRRDYIYKQFFAFLFSPDQYEYII